MDDNQTASPKNETPRELNSTELDEIAGGLGAVNAQFTGLPMEDLIGGPLRAAIEAQKKMAATQADFLKQTGQSQS